jgi:hypothetical protein
VVWGTRLWCGGECDGGHGWWRCWCDRAAGKEELAAGAGAAWGEWSSGCGGGAGWGGGRGRRNGWGIMAKVLLRLCWRRLGLAVVRLEELEVGGWGGGWVWDH